MVECVRGSDTVCRLGGDEFVALLSELDHSEDAAITARRMLKAVATVHSVGDHALDVSASIGVSVYPDDGGDAVTLIKNADIAMYQAKEMGRNNYQFFKPSMNARAVERQFLEEGLARAVERRELALHYQPKINLRTGAISGRRLCCAGPIQRADRSACPVHSRGGRLRPDPADRRLGASRSVRTSTSLGRSRAA